MSISAPSGFALDPNFYQSESLDIKVIRVGDSRIELLINAPIPAAANAGRYGYLARKLQRTEQSFRPAVHMPGATVGEGELSHCVCTTFELAAHDSVTAGYAVVGDRAAYFELHGPARPSPAEAAAMGDLRRVVARLSPAGAAETEVPTRWKGLLMQSPLALGGRLRSFYGREWLHLFCRENDAYQMNVDVDDAPAPGGFAAALRSAELGLEEDMPKHDRIASASAFRSCTFAGRDGFGLPFEDRASHKRGFEFLFSLNGRLAQVDIHEPRDHPDRRLEALLLRPIATLKIDESSH